MYIAKQFFGGKKLEEYDENSKCTCFEKQYGQTIPLDMYVSQIS
jgi:hypothetical protein